VDVRLRRLAEEFDRWAESGRGEEMAREHEPLLQAALPRMNLASGGRYLDLGCGTGWASRLLARTVPDSEVVGVDLSRRMIELARAHPDNPPATTFRVADAHNLPFPDGHCSRLISVESLYYYPDLQAALAEAVRVVEPGGSAFFLIDLYLENEPTHGWVERLSVPVHLLSSDEWCHRL
jgi:ubiquinone/menaquinone biosynthesis C-methylase UbiE